MSCEIARYAMPKTISSVKPLITIIPTFFFRIIFLLRVAFFRVVML